MHLCTAPHETELLYSFVSNIGPQKPSVYVLYVQYVLYSMYYMYYIYYMYSVYVLYVPPV
jgi:hypothetical protein